MSRAKPLAGASMMSGQHHGLEHVVLREGAVAVVDPEVRNRPPYDGDLLRGGQSCTSPAECLKVDLPATLVLWPSRSLRNPGMPQRRNTAEQQRATDSTARRTAGHPRTTSSPACRWATPSAGTRRRPCHRHERPPRATSARTTPARTRTPHATMSTTETKGTSSRTARRSLVRFNPARPPRRRWSAASPGSSGRNPARLGARNRATSATSAATSPRSCRAP